MSEERRVWVWRYWQTGGIKGDVARQWPGGGWNWNGYSSPQGWSFTRDHAIAKADARRLAKIASLKKQIAKLENLKFDEVTK